MSFSSGNIFYRSLKCAEGRIPEAIEMSAETGNAPWIETVKTASPGLAVENETGLLEDAQVLGYGGTADGQAAGQFADGQRAGRELLEDGHACRIGDGIEAGLKVSIHLR
jgi:hypothetical protein